MKHLFLLEKRFRGKNQFIVKEESGPDNGVDYLKGLLFLSLTISNLVVSIFMTESNTYMNYYI